MTQLELQLPDPPTVNVNGYIDEKANMTLLGMATQQFDGSWRCLAVMGDALVLVELNLTLPEGFSPQN